MWVPLLSFRTQLKHHYLSEGTSNYPVWKSYLPIPTPSSYLVLVSSEIIFIFTYDLITIPTHEAQNLIILPHNLLKYLENSLEIQ